MWKYTMIAFAITGCATPPFVYEGTPRAVVVAYGVTNYGHPVSATLGVAEAHCAKFGKHAKFSGRPAWDLAAYDCVD